MIILADPHPHDYKEFSKKTASGISTRLEEFVKSIRYVGDCMQEWKDNVLVILGDLHHLRAYLKVPVYNIVYGELVRLKEAGIQIYILTGNHDQYDQSGVEHSLNAYRPIATIVDVPMKYDIQGTECYFIPYRKNKQEIYKCFEQIKSVAEGSILFMHQTIEGVTLDENQHLYLSKLVMPEFISKKFKYIISGDIHKRQRFGNIIYPGSLLAHNFGDKFQTKGFLYYKDGQLHEYDNPYSPVFVTQIIEKDVDPEKIFQFSETARTYIEVRCKKDFYEKIDSYLKTIPNCCYRMVLLKDKPKLVARSEVKLSLTVENNIVQYVQFAGESRKELIDLGRAIYEEAKQ